MQKFLSGLISLSITFFAAGVLAQEVKTMTGEAEAGAVMVSGNNESDSYSTKGKLVYTFLDKNIFTASGRYLKTETKATPGADKEETARNWEAGLRYERALTDWFSVFAGHKAESDIFNGYIQRDSSDLGLKYYLTQNENNTWFVEAGYRYQKLYTTANELTYSNMGRIYSEYARKLDQTLSFKYWIEYLPNFSDSEAYLVNTEASLNVMINQIFSLKLAYLLQYQNVMPAGSDTYTTKTSTVNLVAKF